MYLAYIACLMSIACRTDTNSSLLKQSSGIYVHVFTSVPHHGVFHCLSKKTVFMFFVHYECNVYCKSLEASFIHVANAVLACYPLIHARTHRFTRCELTPCRQCRLRISTRTLAHLFLFNRLLDCFNYLIDCIRACIFRCCCRGRRGGGRRRHPQP